MPYPLKTSDIRRFLAVNGHTSHETEYANQWYLHQGRICVFMDEPCILESQVEWSRPEVDAWTDNAIDVDAIVEWVEKNPEGVEVSPSTVRRTPSLAGFKAPYGSGTTKQTITLPEDLKSRMLEWMAKNGYPNLSGLVQKAVEAYISAPSATAGPIHIPSTHPADLHSVSGVILELCYSTSQDEYQLPDTSDGQGRDAFALEVLNPHDHSISAPRLRERAQLFGWGIRVVKVLP